MAVCIPDFDQVRKHVEDTCQLPTEVVWGNVGLQVGDIRYCPQIPMLQMQCVSLNTLLSYVSESRFCPKDASSVKASEETAILLLFISNASYTDIEYVHIRLVVICCCYKVGTNLPLSHTSHSSRTSWWRCAHGHKQGRVPCPGPAASVSS